MDEKCKEVLAGLSGKRARSRLAPYGRLILELHRRGYSFRDIVPILSEEFGLNVASTTISRFVVRLEQERSKPRKARVRKEKATLAIPAAPVVLETNKIMPQSDEVRQRIAALKQQKTQAEPDSKTFDYDPEQPLHLVKEDEKNETPAKPYSSIGIL